MGVFKDASELYLAIGGLFEKARTHRAMGETLRKSGLIIRFNYSNPESSLTIDARNPAAEGEYFTVYRGATDVKPDIEMAMEAGVAHQFWLQKLSLTAALARGQMKLKGPLPQILKLLPVIKPAYQMYPEHLKEAGLGHLI